MIDVHIEFAHIYKDQPFSKEQIESIHLLKRTIDSLEREGKSFITSILIDDYHAKEAKWDDLDLLRNMEKRNAVPDYLFYEKSFMELANRLVEMIPNQNKRVEHFKKEGKDVVFFVDESSKFALQDIYADRVEPKCVTLSCAWILCKLGVFDFPAEGFLPICQSDAEPCRSALTILPKQFMLVEENVMRLMTALGKEREKQQVQYLFY